MKIDNSILSVYAAGKPRTTADNSRGTGDGSSATARNIPTVAPTGSMPSGLANTLWLTSAKLEKSRDASESLLAEFLELSKMTPVERLRKELLDNMGMTEESLAQMPPEERSAVEEEIRRAIKQQLGIDETQQAATAEGQTVVGVQEAEA